MAMALPAFAQDDAVAQAPAQSAPSKTATTTDASAKSRDDLREETRASDEKAGVIYVYGRGEKRIGQAIAASEGGVAGADIEIRPLLRPGELLEATPGLIATQHSGGGKANQYFLRGFNLDHGTDFALFIDDFPINFRTHGHGQGYLDVNGLIPETVERVDYRKGPYRADTGDFSFVGSSFITTRDTLAPFATAELGSYGYRRFVAGGSTPLAGGTLLAVGQVKLNDGPWQLPEDFEGYSGFLKYARPLGDGELMASANIYHATWAPTEQLPERAVGTPLCADRFCSLDPTLRGRTDRQIYTAKYQSDDWRITAYLQHYDWSLLSNFTFFLEDPVNGDQLRQYDQRWTYGGRLERTVKLGERLSIRTGAEARVDDIGLVDFDETIARAKDFTVGAFGVKESSLGLYAEAIWRPLERLMVIGGVRGDWYRFRARPVEGAGTWSGTVKDDSFAPKIGLNYELTDGIALYANYGEGFHSNDARGVTNPDSPRAGSGRGRFRGTGRALRARRGDPHRGLLVELDRERAHLCGRQRRGRAERPRTPARIRIDRLLQAQRLAGDRRGVDRIARSLCGIAGRTKLRARRARELGRAGNLGNLSRGQFLRPLALPWPPRLDRGQLAAWRAHAARQHPRRMETGQSGRPVGLRRSPQRARLEG